MDEDTTQEFPKNSLTIILARFEALESSLRADMHSLRSDIHSLGSRMDSLESRIESLESRIESLESRFSALDEKVDRRLMETRPIWQQVLVRLDSVDSRLDRLEEDFDSIGLKFRTFQNDLLRMQRQDERLADRIEKLANPPTAQ